MKTQFIQTAAVIFLLACEQGLGQAIGPMSPPAISPYPSTGAPAVIDGQPYLQIPPMIQSPTPSVPIYPPQTGVEPLPPPGTVFAPPAILPGDSSAPPGSVVPPVVVPQTPGAAVGQPGQAPAAVVVGGPPNPIMVPVINEELAWDQIADVVDDYFKITREQRVRRTGETWTEGRIETAPLTGATVLEPWRKDSVGTFNRWESTFQSIRRRATVRVIPDANGYLVEVIVEKELEDLPKPEKGTVGPVSAFGSQLTLPSKRLDEITRTHLSPKWIPMGRDPALEQRMLADIHARLNGVASSPSVFAP